MLAAGDKAPQFSLPDLDGETQTLSEMLRHGPVVVILYKVGCPVCQLTLPYLQRISSGGLQMVNISQDEPPETTRFMRAYGVSMRTLLDAKKSGYSVSNAFGITHVPSLFLIEPDGVISYAESGFRKTDLEALAARAGCPMFQAEDNVPAWKAG